MRLSFRISVMLVFCLLVVASSARATAQQAPAKLQAALFMKLLAFDANLGQDPFTIHVIGSPEVAQHFRTHVGATAGKAVLRAVSESDSPPDNGAKVVYVGSGAAAATAYCRLNKVLSITGNPRFVNDGVTLGVKIEGGKPKVLLNLSSTKAEDINWNPQILKVASTVE